MKRYNVITLLSSVIVIAIFAIIISIKAQQTTITKTTPPSHDSNPTAQEITSLFVPLRGKGIPIKDVSVLKDSPLEVQITLRSTGRGQVASTDDMWNKHIAARWAELSYLTGTKIDSYRLLLVNDEGKIIGNETIFLNSDYPSQHLTPVSTTVLDEESTLSILKQRLDFLGLTPIHWRVTSGGIVRDHTQVVVVDLLASDVNVLNGTINFLIPSLNRILHQVNADNKMQLAIFRLRVIDEGGSTLVDYILDLETETENWSIDRKINADWFPHPVPSGVPVKQQTDK